MGDVSNSGHRNGNEEQRLWFSLGLVAFRCLQCTGALGCQRCMDGNYRQCIGCLLEGGGACGCCLRRSFPKSCHKCACTWTQCPQGCEVLRTRSFSENAVSIVLVTST